MRVLAVASTGMLGGAEYALATYLAHLPAEVSPSVLVLSPGPAVAQLSEAVGGEVAVARVEGRPGLRDAVAFTGALVGHLARHRPDVVLASGLKAAVMCAPACHARGVPLVWHKVDLSRDGVLTRVVARGCAAVIPVSASAGAAVPARRRLAVVPPPVRLDAAFRVGPERPAATLLSMGRLVPYKGYADVLEAAACLRSDFQDVRVLIAGGEDPSATAHRDALLALARARGLADRVELLGHVEAVDAVYARATVLVQATHREGRYGGEGFGLAAAEAAWAGLPVVATTGETVEDGRTGRVVPPRDPAALARAVAGYLADPAAARAAGAAGAALARERFAPGPLTDRLCDALAVVASGRPLDQRTTTPLASLRARRSTRPGTVRMSGS